MAARVLVSPVMPSITQAKTRPAGLEIPCSVQLSYERRAGYRHTFHALRAAAGVLTATDGAIRAGADSLGHSAPGVFVSHYADPVRIRLAVAGSIPLPRLPDMPAADSAELLSLHRI